MVLEPPKAILVSRAAVGMTAIAHGQRILEERAAPFYHTFVSTDVSVRATAVGMGRLATGGKGTESSRFRCDNPADLPLDSEREKLRTTVSLDDDLLATAQAYTGLEDKSALVREALKALIQREAAKRLANLGGTQPGIEAARPRR